LDEVDGLGNFLELEVVLKEQEPVEAGVTEASRLMERLEIDAESLIPDAYIDLLRRGSPTAQT
jgi:adenylate cyclase